MERNITASSLAIITSLIFCEQGLANDHSPVVIQDGGRELRDDQLYRVKYTCKIQKNLLPTFLEDSRIKQRRYLSFTASTHIFAVTNKGVTLKTDPFGGDITNFVPRHVFTIEGSNIRAQDGSSCGGEFLVYGLDKPTIVYALKYEKYALAAQAFAFFTFIKDTIAPAYRIIRGKDINEKDSEAIKQIGEVAKNYKEYLSFFKDELASTVTEIDLKTKRNIISTDVSDIYIDVTPIESALLSSLPFRSGFDSFVKLTPPGDLANIEKVCTTMKRDILESGFKSDVDQAYILYRVLDLESKDKYIECLGPDDLVQFVLNQRGLYESNIPRSQLITAKDVAEYVDKKGKSEFDAKWLTATKTMVDSLTELLRRYGALDEPIPPGDAEEFAKLTATDLEVDDRTPTASFSDLATDGKGRVTITKGVYTAQFDRLKRRGFRNFGCYHLTSEPTIRGFDNASAMMLAMKSTTKPDGNTTNETIGLRLFIADEKLKKIVITDRFIEEVRAASPKCRL